MEYSVYKHTTPNGKVYIGITSVEKKMAKRLGLQNAVVLSCNPKVWLGKH